MKTAIKLDIPSSGAITGLLSLDYNGEYEPEEVSATYGYSVPLITDEDPRRLRYFPLSKTSETTFSEDFNEDIFFNDHSGKKNCVLICRGITVTKENEAPKERTFAESVPLFFIAGLWDATEDPLMATTLYSCTMLSRHTGAERIPCFLTGQQIPAWLNKDLSLADRLKSISGK